MNRSWCNRVVCIGVVILFSCPLVAAEIGAGGQQESAPTEGEVGTRAAPMQKPGLVLPGNPPMLQTPPIEKVISI